MTDLVRPQPRPTEVTQPFWDATARGEFLIQRCRGCGLAIHYPRVNCGQCGSIDLDWERASGHGVIHTFTVARRPTHRAFAEADPLIIAIVELAEGPHVTTNIVDCEPDEVNIGAAVEITFADEIDGVAIPLFRLSVA
jgi:uncharacterized OB-fold protein